MTTSNLFRTIVLKVAATQLLALGPNPATAQSAPLSDSTRGPGFALSVRVSAGYTNFNLNDLNSRLARTGLPEVSPHNATLGIGADLRVKRLVLGAGWQSLATRTSNDEPYRTRVTGGVGLLNAGFVLVKLGRFIAYPSIGIGGRVMSIDVQERGDFSFDDGLSQLRRATDLTAVALLYDLGGGMEWEVSRTVPLAITARAGLVRNLGAEHWYAKSGDVHAGPRSARGSYIQFGISTALPVRSLRRSVAGEPSRD